MTESERYTACKIWIENELLLELYQMPVWTYAAFSQLKDGDVLDKDDPRIDLIRYLVSNHIQKIPDHMYDADFRHSWKVQEFIPVIKHVLGKIKEAREKRD